jgi:GPI mannosyltransferase 4
MTIFWSSWILFNLILSTLMGVFHQAGVIPSVLSLPSLIPPALNTTNSNAHNIEVFYWKTYPPPTYLLGSPPPTHPTTNQSLNISMVPLMGIPQSELVFMLMQHFPTCDPGLLDFISPHPEPTEVLVAAPLSAWKLPGDGASKPDTLLNLSDPSFSIHFPDQRATLGMRSLEMWRKHINLDDLDIGEEGIVGTLRRVWGRRGLAIWRVERICEVTTHKSGEDW